jgi:hypothetical protein
MTSVTSIPSGPQRAEIRRVFEDPRVCATTLVTALFDMFGSEVASWEPETIESAVSDDVGAQAPRLNMDKIQALLLALTTDVPFNDALAFNRLGEAFNNDPVDVATIDPLTPDQAAWAIAELALTAPGVGYGDNVKKYVQAIFELHGLPGLPASISQLLGVESSGLPRGGTDDPDAFAARGARIQREFDDIEAYVSGKLSQLMNEVDTLPLTNIDKSSWGQLKESLSLHQHRPTTQPV